MAKDFGGQALAMFSRENETTGWATTPANAQTNLIPLLSESISRGSIRSRDEKVGRTTFVDSDEVGQTAMGTISTELYYEGLEYLLACAMGYVDPSVSAGAFGAVTNPGSPATTFDGANVHLFECDNELAKQLWSADERDSSSGEDPDAEYWSVSDAKVRRGTLIVNGDPTGTNEGDMLVSAMVNAATFTFGQKCKVDWELIGSAKKRVTQSASSWAAGSEVRVLWPDLRVRLHAAGSGQPNRVSSCTEATLKIENNLQADAFGTSVDADLQAQIMEPIRDGLRTITGTMRFGRYRQNELALFEGDTEVAIEIEATSSVFVPGSSVYRYQYRFLIPRAKITKVDFPVSGPGVISGDLEWEALRPESTPAWVTTALGGMTLRKNNEMIVLLQNGRPWSWLRDRHDGAVRP